MGGLRKGKNITIQTKNYSTKFWKISETADNNFKQIRNKENSINEEQDI